jgi:hypothetical protein
MSATPKWLIVPDGQWAQCEAKHHIHLHYEKFGIHAGGFFCGDEDAIYVVESRQGDAGLLCHEYGHACDYPLNAHPTDIWPGLQHASQVGFDQRAFTWLLRWFDNRDLRLRFEAWRGATKATPFGG